MLQLCPFARALVHRHEPSPVREGSMLSGAGNSVNWHSALHVCSNRRNCVLGLSNYYGPTSGLQGPSGWRENQDVDRLVAFRRFFHNHIVRMRFKVQEDRYDVRNVLQGRERWAPRLVCWPRSPLQALRSPSLTPGRRVKKVIKAWASHPAAVNQRFMPLKLIAQGSDPVVVMCNSCTVQSPVPTRTATTTATSAPVLARRAGLHACCAARRMLACVPTTCGARVPFQPDRDTAIAPARAGVGGRTRRCSLCLLSKGKNAASGKEVSMQQSEQHFPRQQSAPFQGRERMRSQSLTR